MKNNIKDNNIKDKIKEWLKENEKIIKYKSEKQEQYILKDIRFKNETGEILDYFTVIYIIESENHICIKFKNNYNTIEYRLEILKEKIIKECIIKTKRDENNNYRDEIIKKEREIILDGKNKVENIMISLLYVKDIIEKLNIIKEIIKTYN